MLWKVKKFFADAGEWHGIKNDVFVELLATRMFSRSGSQQLSADSDIWLKNIFIFISVYFWEYIIF